MCLQQQDCGLRGLNREQSSCAQTLEGRLAKLVSQDSDQTILGPLSPSWRWPPWLCAPGGAVGAGRLPTHTLTAPRPTDTPARRSLPNTSPQTTAHRVTPPRENHRVWVKAGAPQPGPPSQARGLEGQDRVPRTCLPRLRSVLVPPGGGWSGHLSWWHRPAREGRLRRGRKGGTKSAQSSPRGSQSLLPSLTVPILPLSPLAPGRAVSGASSLLLR